MLAPDQRRLLGDFIRAHRERMRSAIGSGRRRRTPGLRREELAAEAGISTTWCTWLEQGREVQASPEALSRLARALSLSRAERAYLFELAGRRDPEVATDAEAEDAPVSLRTLVASVTVPAYGLDRLWTACCWNAPAARLFAGWLDRGGDRNLLRFVFLEARARRLIPDWEERACRLLAEFRADYAVTFRDGRVGALIDQLRRDSALFAEAWENQQVHVRSGGLRVFDHPADGVVAFEQHTFSPAERPDYKFVMLVPRTEPDSVPAVARRRPRTVRTVGTRGEGKR
jgi:transcriptional regulator with XRE-family HTH domain